MKPKIIGIGIVAILVVVTLVIAGGLIGGTEYWETPAGFGIWQDELIIEYEDGTEESLKVIQESMDNPLTVYYGGKAINGVQIKLTAKATGTGYDGAEVKIAGFGYNSEIRQGSSVKYTGGAGRTDTTFNIGMGATSKMHQSGINLQATVDNDPSTFPDGTYIVTFTPKGTVQYRGYPDGGDWKTASLPPARSISINVERTPTGSILVTLYSDLIT